MIKIYGDPISGNCLKVKWTCERLGVAFQWINVDVAAAETRTPSFLALNPAGQVPAVVLEDGRALAQSNAIIFHLAEGSDLIPSTSYERAKMLEWLFWEQYSHEPYVAVARFQMKYLGKARHELDPKLLERGSAALQRLDQALAGADFLVGGRLSLADIALVAYTRMAGDGGFDLGAYPAVSDWIAWSAPCRSRIRHDSILAGGLRRHLHRPGAGERRLRLGLDRPSLHRTGGHRGLAA